MANLKSAVKRINTNEKKRQQNQVFRSSMRTNVKRVESLVNEKNLEEAQSALKTAIKSIDKAVQKGVVHENKGARLKSRLNQKVANLDA